MATPLSTLSIERLITLESTHPARVRGEDAGTLQQAIARADEVDPPCVLAFCGADPVPSAILPAVIRQRLLRSPRLLFRELIRNRREARPYQPKNKMPNLRDLRRSRQGDCKAKPCLERCESQRFGMTGQQVFPWLRPRYTPAGGGARHARPLDVGPHPGEGFRLSPAQILAAADGPAVLHLAHPHPSGGALIRPEVLAEVMAQIPDLLVWIDESRLPSGLHADPHGFAALIGQTPNLLISRSFADRASGLAASRLGYVLGAPEALAPHRDASFTRIDRFSAGLCVEALRDTDRARRRRWQLQQERAWFSTGLERHRIEVFPGVGDQILCRFRDGRPALSLIYHLRHGVLTAPEADQIRLIDAPEALSWFSLPIRSPAENRRLLSAIDDCLDL